MANKNSEYLVIDGGTVKTEEDGIVTGLGIVFGSETETDQSQERDFFTTKSYIRKKAEFTIPLYYDHGVGLIKEEVGEAKLTKTKDGWFTEARIDTSDPLGAKVYEAVKAEKHGFSTGALNHLVEREAKANGSHFLKKWVPGEISLTKRPAERRATVQSVKSIDGDIVYEDIFDDEITVAIFDEDGTKLWDINDDIKVLPEIKNAKTINIKDVSGSVNYSLYIQDENSDQGASISVYQWGGAQSLIDHIQNVLNVASDAVASEAMDPGMGDMSMGNMDMSKNLDSRIEKVVKSILETRGEDISQLTKKLEDKEGELLELRQSLAASEKALADLKREQFAEILAGADETIKLNKGN